MKILLQRVAYAVVRVNGEEIARIGKGILALVGIEEGDAPETADHLAEKTALLRIFPDDAGKMNLSCLDIGGEILAVSQFTLAGNCSKGRRPSFDKAAHPDSARTLYERYIKKIEACGIATASGRFAADMKIELLNDGPVTFLLEK
ncbi:MAG: D-tyrosyl-tRNA(Tyr) deacylase [Nitrospinae bacterium CG11_big_fil_rev_8_21_14_0_20_45_15]|nr:MAG: D-tyrosyl-tRNA(Tyr) deacylase [Nitrospinae bacterium CG11_big_fil_rev_8_21_14_0_20_45_15]